MKKQTLCLALVLMAGRVGAAPQVLSYADLVKRLTDLENVAVLPLAGEKGALASSYDRASKFDEASGKYVKWDANGDGGGIIRREGDQEVLAEMTGPGCIWRIWSATPGDGHVRIFLDGAEKPAVDLPFKAYFDGKNAPFNYPGLVYKTAANGFNSFVPVPFGKSCKIVADKGWGQYYQFTYSTFPADTKAPTFTRELGDADKAALETTSKFLATGGGSDPAALFGARAGEETQTQTLAVAPGAVAALPEISGPRAITALRLKVNPAQLGEGAKALREAVLRIRWDGEAAPSVWVPLGDFFGSAPGLNAYKSLPLGLVGDEFYSYWYMPFGKSARVEVLNEGKTPLDLGVTLTTAPLTKPLETLGRFHAKWHRDSDLPDPASGRAIDWTLLRTQGKGRFVGVMLHVWNLRGGWWGEGDEKFFVDGEKFPSTIGTGSEDYFGYAWSSMKPFFQALHNQPNSESKTGNNSVNRWHIADNVPFQSSFDGSIEKYFPNTRPTLFTSTVYWYLAPGGTDPYGAAPLAERVDYYGALPVVRIAGSIEGESATITDKTGGDARPQDLSGFGGQWSGRSHLWWTGAKPGDKLTLTLPVAEAGKYNLSAQFTKAKDYGIAQLYLDGQKIGAPLDFYNPTVVPTGALALGEFTLTAGDHQFTIEITGANDKAEKAYMVGLDYLKAVKNTN